MSDKLGHRLVVDHWIFAGCQEMHSDLEIQKIKALATPSRFIEV
jgi:hypothetical protein